MRPYKGIDLMLEAFREIPDAELWIVGRPMMDVEPLRELAPSAPPSSRVRFLPRFITDPEIPALFRRADVVVLPVPRGRPVRRPLHGARVRQGDRRHRRRRLPRASPRSDGALRLVPAGDAERARGGARRRRRRRPRPRAARARRARRRRGPLLVGPRRRADPRPLRSLLGDGPAPDDDRARDRLLGLGRADRLDPRSAIRSRSGCSQGAGATTLPRRRPSCRASA